ncbi:MAG: hypothetical protein L0177_17795 [Chloroflexi bacterium]|nr:hypothetical protein [Chloroflexota bacterium]
MRKVPFAIVLGSTAIAVFALTEGSSATALVAAGVAAGALALHLRLWLVEQRGLQRRFWTQLRVAVTEQQLKRGEAAAPTTATAVHGDGDA